MISRSYAVLARVSPSYPPPQGRLSTRYSPVRRSTGVLLRRLARLACVKHAASVHSEPGSNSPVCVPVPLPRLSRACPKPENARLPIPFRRPDSSLFGTSIFVEWSTLVDRSKESTLHFRRLPYHPYSVFNEPLVPFEGARYCQNIASVSSQNSLQPRKILRPSFCSI